MAGSPVARANLGTPTRLGTIDAALSTTFKVHSYKPPRLRPSHRPRTRRAKQFLSGNNTQDASRPEAPSRFGILLFVPVYAGRTCAMCTDLAAQPQRGCCQGLVVKVRDRHSQYQTRTQNPPYEHRHLQQPAIDQNRPHTLLVLSSCHEDHEPVGHIPILVTTVLIAGGCSNNRGVVDIDHILRYPVHGLIT